MKRKNAAHMPAQMASLIWLLMMCATPPRAWALVSSSPWPSLLLLTPPMSSTLLRVAARLHDVREDSYLIPYERLNPIITFGTTRIESRDDKPKLVNVFGLWCVAVSLVTCPLWWAAMTACKFIQVLEPGWDADRSFFDQMGKLWAKSWLSLILSYPTCSGDMQRLQAAESSDGPCLYVANHASWLDIPVLCTVLDPAFKFIAKGELSNIPCIGQQLKGGKHVLIDRDDRRSQLATFKASLAWLKRGVSIMAFPEGQRSVNGRLLLPFKGGLFSLAVKAKVPIVPLSLSHTHAIMPREALLPVQPGYGKLHVHVHEAIATTGRTEEELEVLVREALLSTLPYEQHPLQEDWVTTPIMAAAKETTTLPSRPPLALGGDPASTSVHYAFDVKKQETATTSVLE